MDMQSQKSHPAEKTFLAIALLLVLATSAQFAQAQTYKFKVLHTKPGGSWLWPLDLFLAEGGDPGGEGPINNRRRVW